MEIERHSKILKYSLKYVTYKLQYPNGNEIIETKTIEDFRTHYHTEDNIFSISRKCGVFIFKRRTSRTKHPFPEGTKLEYMSEVKACDI